MIEQILTFIAILISILTLILIAILICSISYHLYIAMLEDKIEIPIDNKDKPIGSFINDKDITDELYNRSDGSTLVDNAWTCGCGQLNAEYRQECGKCNQPKR